MELSVLPGYSVATISHVHCPTRFDKCANQFTLIVFLFAAAFIFTLARSVDGVLAFFFLLKSIVRLDRGGLCFPEKSNRSGLMLRRW